MDPASPPHACGPQTPLTRCYWQARYDEGRTAWDRGAASPALVGWLDSGALRPGRIVVPGCGRGHEVVALAEAGFEVTAIDYAPAAVEAVRERLVAAAVAADVVAADLFAYEPKAPFDAVYEQTCLCALPPQRWHDYERRLWSWLVPGGIVAAAFMQTDGREGPPFACPPDQMRALFTADRWEWPADLVAVPHPMGLVELTGLLRKRAA